jgi:hypothetical protein
MQTVTYNFNPNDQMWILDNNSVKKGVCIQTEIKIVPSGNTYTTIINYIVLLECNSGTIVASDQYSFASLSDALIALQGAIANQTC